MGSPPVTDTVSIAHPLCVTPCEVWLACWVDCYTHRHKYRTHALKTQYFNSTHYYVQRTHAHAHTHIHTYHAPTHSHTTYIHNLQYYYTHTHICHEHSSQQQTPCRPTHHPWVSCYHWPSSTVWSVCCASWSTAVFPCRSIQPLHSFGNDKVQLEIGMLLALFASPR